MKHLLQKPLFQFFFLLFGGGLFLWLLGCFDWLFSEPTGVHYIRQTDCLAFVQHYFQHGNPWWQPAVYDLNTFEGRGASEFPLFYYLIAKIWSYTGQVDWYLRLWNFGWVIAGIVGFWFFLKRELQSVWISWMVCLLTFTGTVFWYYAPNYLPDVASLGMCFIGFYFLTHENRTRKTLLLTFLFLTLAGLMKPTLLVLPTAFVLSNVLIDILQSIKNQRLVLHSKGIVLAFSSAILVSFAWVVYVKWYNSSVNNIYFLFEPRPIWTNSVEERSEVWSFLSEKWAYRRYANDQVLQLWSAMMILPLLGFRKLKLKWYLTHLFSLLGSVCLFLLFFSQYKHHDYYFLAMIPSIGLGIFCTFQLLSALSISKWLKRGVYSYVLVILILSFKSTRQGLTERKVHKVDLFSSIEHKLQASDEVLDSLGSKRSDMLFILGDYSINGGLRLTKRKGWSRGELNEESRKIIDDVVGFGAKYLINSEPKKYNSTQFGEVVYTNEFIEIVKF